MKLGEIDVEKLVQALRDERLGRVNAASESGRKITDSEKATISILRAFENVLVRTTPNQLNDLLEEFDK